MFSWRRGRTGGDCTPAAETAGGSSSGYWLIAKYDNGPLELQTVDLDGQKLIPVFSFREEAEMYMRFEVKGSWWVRKTSAGELISLLFGPYSCVEMVALDPLPEICDEGMTRLLSVSKKHFARVLLSDRGEGSPSPLARQPIDLRVQRRRQPSHHAR